MTQPEPTLDILRLLFDGTAQGAALDYALAQDHRARVAAVQKGIDFACNELVLHRDKKKGLGEDAITIELCSMMKMAGFQAAHDKDTGGHSDVSIEGKDMFLWLAEAKEHSSYGWLDKGFLQLTTRYSTGVKGQDHADILVYCYIVDAKAMLEKWREELEARHPEVVTKDSPCGNPLLFCSTHKHTSSGQDFHVRHKVVALHWKPKDK